MMGWMATLQIRDRCESRDLIVGPPRLELYRRSASMDRLMMLLDTSVTNSSTILSTR